MKGAHKETRTLSFLGDTRTFKFEPTPYERIGHLHREFANQEYVGRRCMYVRRR
jgi:hypothetical protein